MSDLEPEVSFDGVTYRWRGSLTDAEMVGLVRAHGGRAVQGWWDQIHAYSLGWVTARAADGAVIGFVNVAWDGGDHVFLLDTKTHSVFQHKGIGTRLVELAARRARAAGCEWLHVDFDPGAGALLFRRLRVRAGARRAHPPPVTQRLVELERGVGQRPQVSPELRVWLQRARIKPSPRHTDTSRT
jgi:GNAT superfamily N-acetyltransferase